MTYDEMIDVIRAYKNGAKLQYRLVGDVDWWEANTPRFNFFNKEYRVKPEKMKLYMGIYKDNTTCTSYRNESFELFKKRTPSAIRYVEFVEV